MSPHKASISLIQLFFLCSNNRRSDYFSGSNLRAMTEKEFENIYRTYFAMMCTIANTIVKDRETATDIAQQVFVNFWSRKDEIIIQSNIKSYLHRSTINTALNHLEKQAHIQLSDDMSAYSESTSVEGHGTYLEGEVEQAIVKAISTLPPKCQEVFSLSRYQGMSNQEIADTLNISIKSVEKHITKALKDLRELLRPYLNYSIIFFAIEVGLSLVWLSLT